MISQDEIAKAFNLLRSTGLLTDEQAEELSFRLNLTCPIPFKRLPIGAGTYDYGNNPYFDKQVDWECSDCRQPLKTLSAYYEHTCPKRIVDE